ncbi:MAG: hypothetical protein M9961_14125 [Ilumatobacteraceae bacterium]|nr:hypothetical protein [Ilumatobacter sp.]MCO5331209.1 hypothetical protein [Ilumatobacteraceae bacterium]
MTTRRTLHLALAGTLAVATLAACSSEKTSTAESTTSIGDTTTVAESTTSVGDATTVPATEAPTTPAPTEAPTTPAPTAATTAPPVGPVYGLYDEVSPPTVPSTHTTAPTASGTLPDGTYWTLYNGGDEMLPSVTVYQAFFGPECITQAAAMGDECLNDIFVQGDPSRDIDDMPFADDVYLTVADAATMHSFWITPAELVQIRASSPSAGAPAGYDYVPFAYMMTVEDGVIVSFQQVWTP